MFLVILYKKMVMIRKKEHYPSVVTLQIVDGTNPNLGHGRSKKTQGTFKVHRKKKRTTRNM